MSHPTQENLSDYFNICNTATETPKAQKKQKPLLPISFRVTQEEKKHLTQAAGKTSVSSYVRQCVLGDLANVRPTCYRKRKKRAINKFC